MMFKAKKLLALPSSVSRYLENKVVLACHRPAYKKIPEL
jgi:hypothetical protein